MLDVSAEVVITEFKNFYPICNQKWMAGEYGKDLKDGDNSFCKHLLSLYAISHPNICKLVNIILASQATLVPLKDHTQGWQSCALKTEICYQHHPWKLSISQESSKTGTIAFRMANADPFGNSFCCSCCFALLFSNFFSNRSYLWQSVHCRNLVGQDTDNYDLILCIRDILKQLIRIKSCLYQSQITPMSQITGTVQFYL